MCIKYKTHKRDKKKKEEERMKTNFLCVSTKNKSSICRYKI